MSKPIEIEEVFACVNQDATHLICSDQTPSRRNKGLYFKTCSFDGAYLLVYFQVKVNTGYEWPLFYSGPDIKEAVRIYNELE